MRKQILTRTKRAVRSWIFMKENRIMEIKNPTELTKDNLRNWITPFLGKLKKTTTRNDRDRLILAVERKEFKDEWMPEWEELTFAKGKAEIEISWWDKEG